MAVQSLVIVRNACAHVGGPENFGDSAGVPLGRWGPLGMGRGWSPKNLLLPHSCYHANFDHSTSDGIRA